MQAARNVLLLLAVLAQLGGAGGVLLPAQQLAAAREGPGAQAALALQQAVLVRWLCCTFATTGERGI